MMYSEYRVYCIAKKRGLYPEEVPTYSSGESSVLGYQCRTYRELHCGIYLCALVWLYSLHPLVWLHNPDPQYATPDYTSTPAIPFASGLG